MAGSWRRRRLWRGEKDAIKHWLAHDPGYLADFHALSDPRDYVVYANLYSVHIRKNG